MFKLKPYVFEEIEGEKKYRMPYKEYHGDAGWDVFNYSPDRILIPGERFKFPLGFAIEIPENWVALIQGKSGLSVNNGITTIGNVIDSTYRGQCHATLLNTGNEPVVIRRGQKIAQMLIVPCYTGKYYKIVDELSKTDRGTGGFGSTGLEAK
jgi:dUTP pyrophosphatase